MRTRTSLLITVLIAILFAVGCKKDDDGDSGPSLTGLWNGTLTLSGDNFPFRLDLEQSGTSISGTFEFSDGSGHTTISGSVSGDNVSMNCIPEGLNMQWSGTANSERTSMSGSMTITYGGASVSGIPWNATKSSSGGSAKAVPAGKTLSESLRSLIN